ncbi:MAG TPA: hypothetical protein VF329_15560 [Gammaproteobacteria bacterium]
MPRCISPLVAAAGLAMLLPIPASADGDLSGVWLHRSDSRGNPVTQWSADELPFSPAGQERFDSNKPGKGPRQGPPALGNDPIGGANPPGLYRTLVYNRPFEFIQTPQKIVQLFEWAKVWRVIWTDGREVPEDVAAGPYWYGYSVGKWEGDTLVVQTVGLDGRAWLDEWGTPFSDNARIEERWRRVDEDALELTITVHDPDSYSEPWTSDPQTYRLQPKGSPNGELLEVIFAPIDEQIFNERIRDPAAAGPEP